MQKFHIKYVPALEHGDEPCFYMIGNKEAYGHAIDFLTKKAQVLAQDPDAIVYLNDPEVAIYHETGLIDQEALRLTRQDCLGLIKEFQIKYENGASGNGHLYGDTKALEEMDLDIYIAGEKDDYSFVLEEEHTFYFVPKNP